MQQPDRNAIDIFSFTDSRQFLKSYYEWRKTGDRKFSHRFICSKVGAGSMGWFADILTGRSGLSGGYRLKLIKLLHLKPKEEAYFEVLVDYSQAKTVEEKNQHYKKMMSFKEIKPYLVDKDQFEFYSKWYHSAIRELLFFYPFKNDLVELAKKLDPPIRTEQAKQSVLLLEKLGFIRRDGHGNFRPTSETLRKDNSFKSLHLMNFFKATTDLGLESFTSREKEERDISSLTLSLSATGFRRAREEVQALRKKLLALTDEDLEPEKVFQCNFLIYPMTK